MALLPSVRRPEFAIKPTGRLRFEGIRCNDAYLNVIAFRAFEQPVFETNWTRCNALQHHPRLAVRTAMALDSVQELWGRDHDTSLHWAGALPNSQSPMVAYGGGDRTRIVSCKACLLVNIAHSRKNSHQRLDRSGNNVQYPRSFNILILEPSTSLRLRSGG
jgi:hypothetical protein